MCLFEVVLLVLPGKNYYGWNKISIGAYAHKNYYERTSFCRGIGDPIWCLHLKAMIWGNLDCSIQMPHSSTLNIWLAENFFLSSHFQVSREIRFVLFIRSSGSCYRQKVCRLMLIVSLCLRGKFEPIFFW